MKAFFIIVFLAMVSSLLIEGPLTKKIKKAEDLVDEMGK
jgi:hypothetical protein